MTHHIAPRDMRSFFVGAEKLRNYIDQPQEHIEKSPVKFYHVRADILRMQEAKREVGRHPLGLRRVRDLEREVRDQIDTWIEEFVAAMNTEYGYAVNNEKCVYFQPHKDDDRELSLLLQLRESVLVQYAKAIEGSDDPQMIARFRAEVTAMTELHQQWKGLDQSALYIWHSPPPRERTGDGVQSEERAKQGFGEDMHSFLFYAQPMGNGQVKVLATTLVHTLSEAHAADFLREYADKGAWNYDQVHQLSDVPNDVELLRVPTRLRWNLEQIHGFDDIRLIAKKIECLLESNELRNAQYPEFLQRQVEHKVVRVSDRDEMQRINAMGVDYVERYIARLKTVSTRIQHDDGLERELRQYLYAIWEERKKEYVRVKSQALKQQLESANGRALSEFEEGMVREKFVVSVEQRAKGVQCAEMRMKTKVMVKKMVDGQEVWVEEEQDEVCELKCRCGKVYYLQEGEKKDVCDECGWDGKAETRSMWPNKAVESTAVRNVQPIDDLKKSQLKGTRIGNEKKFLLVPSMPKKRKPLYINFDSGEVVYDMGLSVMRRLVRHDQLLSFYRQVTYRVA